VREVANELGKAIQSDSKRYSADIATLEERAASLRQLVGRLANMGNAPEAIRERQRIAKSLLASVGGRVQLNAQDPSLVSASLIESELGYHGARHRQTINNSVGALNALHRRKLQAIETYNDIVDQLDTYAN
jgi:hypothetical protein